MSAPKRLARDTADRTTHAISADCHIAVVRYEKAGKWRLVDRARGTSNALTLADAVAEALAMEAEGGRIFTGRVGGMRFSAEVAKTKAAR